MRADVTSEEQIEEAFRAAVLAFGGVDLVVNNAGISISKPLLETSAKDWDLQHDIMARGSFLVSREAARVMIAQRLGGDLVYIASKNAVFAGPNNIAYSAAKADQAHQVRLLAAELGEHGIRVNGVNPDGVVRGSGIFAGGWGAQRAAVYGVPEEKLGEFYAQRTLLKREVLPDHVAAAVFALTGGDLTHTTGLHVPVDAGVAAAFLMNAGRGRRGGRPRRVQRARHGRPRGPRQLARLTEVHRFANRPVRVPEGLRWDVLGLYAGVLEGLREAGGSCRRRRRRAWTTVCGRGRGCSGQPGALP
ncbi:3-phenylpropionate-dihydrodiol/cinnamic acid-dihydrodiol dehydrogenase [Streptomyces hirsutus]